MDQNGYVGKKEVNIPASAEELISRFSNYFLSAGDLLTTLKIKRKVPAS